MHLSNLIRREALFAVDGSKHPANSVEKDKLQNSQL